MESLFQGNFVKSKRIIYTPSNFAKTNLIHLQEVGELTAIKPHVNSREGLNSFLFFVVTNGEGKLIYENKTYTVTKGDCVIIDCKRTYSHSSSLKNLWSLKWVHFFGPNLNSIYEKYTERGGLSVFTPKCYSDYFDKLEKIFTIAASEDYIRDMRLNEELTSLLTLLMSESCHPENTARTGAKKQSLQNIKKHIEEHYTEKICLDDLAERFFINKFYLTRVFKEQFGITLLSYLDSVRITRAKQLLRFSELTVEEVGREVGIDDGTYFNRVFKKVEGITPGEYRRMWE